MPKTTFKTGFAANEHDPWEQMEDQYVPKLGAIWDRALSLPLTDTKVQDAFRSLQRVKASVDVQVSLLVDALKTSPPKLVLVDGPGHKAYASYQNGVIRLRLNIASALRTIRDYKDTLCFYILSLILHEMGHHIYRCFNGFASESNEQVQFGGFFGMRVGRGPQNVGESGYYIEGLLWGGTICAGVETSAGQLHVHSAEDVNWHLIRTISVCPHIDSTEHYVVLLAPSLRRRLTGPSLPSFSEDELALATRMDFLWTHRDALAQSNGNFNNMERGDQFLFNKMAPSKDLRLVVGEAHGCTPSYRAARA